MRLSARDVRLVSGLVLFAYVTAHLLNHATMNVSLAAAEAYAHAMFAFVGLPPVRAVLYAALAAHFALALAAIYRRRDLRAMSRGEIVQLAAGLLIVPVMLPHVVPVRFGPLLYDTTPFHTLVVLVGTQFDPVSGALAIAGILLVWIHGTIGLHMWLRLKPGYAPWRPWLLGAAVALCVLALAGYRAGAREAALLFADPVWRETLSQRYRMPDDGQRAVLGSVSDAILAMWALSIAGAFAARRFRRYVEHRRGRIIVSYPGGATVIAALGATLLDASRQGHIPHASMCGGRGRCSTCRVRVEQGAENLPPASADEQAVLARVGAPAGVRLACQVRPTGDVSVVPLLPANASVAMPSRRGERDAAGREKTIAVMFADLRGFTALSETKLPFDVVFLLNRYFAEMGAAIEAAGGRIDKFVGDGIVALFGVETGPERGTREAIAGARAMIERLASLNSALAHDLPRPLRIGIGIHTGPAIVGEMGYAQARQFTAIGDTVNTASRLEALTKEFKADLLVSGDAAAASGLDLSAYPERTTDIRGRKGSLAVRVIADARTLPPP